MHLSPLLLAFVGQLRAIPASYWAIWLATLGLSVALIIMLRSRWGTSRPLHKCAVMSLLVHVVLAWLAMTVRIVAGDGSGNGDGMGPPIRVRVIEGAAEDPFVAEAAEKVEAPALLEAPSVEEVEEAAAEAPKAESVAELPAELETNVAETHEAKTEEPDSEADEKQIEIDALAESEPAKASPLGAEMLADAEVGASRTPEEVVSPSPNAGALAEQGTAIEATITAVAARRPKAPQATSPYSLRVAEGRLGLVEQQGGSGQTESAVSAALKWLAATQSRDGRWDADDYGSGQEEMVLNQNRGGAGRNADTGVSALALLAFLGAGHSHLHGDYQDTVRSGIDFLLRSQASDGSLFGESTLYAQMYCHAMATFALAEAQAMTGDRRFQAAVERAVNFSIAAQNTAVGGWRYRPGDSGDTSQLGWQMMALASAERAGIGVPANTWQRVERFLGTVRRGNHGGLAAYRPDGPASTSMTAEAMYCRLLLAETQNNRTEDAVLDEATAALLASLPNEERVNLYYWYYATLALHHRFAQDERATDAWQKWNDAMTSAIVATQLTSGPNAGSWETNTIWGGYGGRIYTTAMATMCLEVYYRYGAVPGSRSQWTANRPSGEVERQ